MLNTRVQGRAEQIAHRMARREDLVRDFIVEAQDLWDAVVSNEPKTLEVVSLYAMVWDRLQRSVARAVSRPGVVKVTGLTDALDDTPARERALPGKSAPLGQRNRASLLVNLPGDQMALLTEMILDLGVN